MNIHPLDDEPQPQDQVIYAEIAGAKSTSQNRLQIWHLMLLTILVAAFVAMDQFILSFDTKGFFAPKNSMHHMQQLLLACLRGASVAILIAWVVNGLRFGGWFEHPGHGFALANGVTMPLHFLAFSLLVITMSNEDHNQFVFNMLSGIRFMISAAAISILFVIFIIKLKKFHWSWLFIFAIILMQYCLDMFLAAAEIVANTTSSYSLYDYFTYLIGVINFFQAVVFIGLLTVAVIDFRSKKNRDWIHWLSVGIVLASALMYSVFSLIHLLTMPK